MSTNSSRKNSYKIIPEDQYREAMYRLFSADSKMIEVREGRTQPKPKSLHKTKSSQSRQTSYIDKIAGPAPHQSSAKPVMVRKGPKVNKDGFLAEEFTVSDRRPFSVSTIEFAREHNKIILRLCFATLSFVFIASGIVLVSKMRHQDAPQVAGTSNVIAPKTVFMPKPMPDGFTIGSGKQELDNGAILYTVFGPKGEQITLTQQQSAPDFDQRILAGGKKFTTLYGTAYILPSVERLTGYLLAEDSWVLLNNTDGLASEDMEVLIRSLEPI